MAVVVDASALLAIALEESIASDLRRRLATYTTEQHEFYAPVLIVYEFASGIAKAATRGRLNHSEIGTASAFIEEVPLNLRFTFDVVAPAIARAASVGRLNAYDMFYIEMALELEAVLLTIDSSLASIAREAGVVVDGPN